MPDEKKQNILSRDDLFLMMESYKNTVELNTILLSNVKKVLENQETCDKVVGKVFEKLDDNLEMHRDIVNTLKNILGNFEKIDNSFEIRMEKQKNFFYGFILTGLATVGIMIKLLIDSYSRFSLIEKNYHILEQIAKHLGV